MPLILLSDEEGVKRSTLIPLDRILTHDSGVIPQRPATRV